MVDWWLSSLEESHHGESRSGAGEAVACPAHAVAGGRANHFRILQSKTSEQTLVQLLATEARFRPARNLTGGGDVRANEARHGTVGRGRAADRCDAQPVVLPSRRA